MRNREATLELLEAIAANLETLAKHVRLAKANVSEPDADPASTNRTRPADMRRVIREVLDTVAKKLE